MAIDQVSLPSSLGRRAAPAVGPLLLAVVGGVLALSGEESRLSDAFSVLFWAGYAATILVPAWRNRRLPALVIEQEGLRGSRGESILRWGEVAGIWIGYQPYRWLPWRLRPLTMFAWDAASLDFARRADARALPRVYKVIATGMPDDEVVNVVRRFTVVPVESGQHLSRRRFLRTLIQRLP